VAEREVLTRSSSQRLLDHRVAILAADKEVGGGCTLGWGACS
jgi:hypothetical protein